MGIMYSHVTPDCLKNFHKFSEEIAAHYSEVRLIYTEFDTDTQALFTYWSNDGVLRLVKDCEILRRKELSEMLAKCGKA